MSRIQSDAAAAALGISRRKVQEMAAAGQLPGAAKIGDVWTFDPLRLDAFIAGQEAMTHFQAPRRVRRVAPSPSAYARFMRTGR